MSRARREAPRGGVWGSGFYSPKFEVEIGRKFPPFWAHVPPTFGLNPVLLLLRAPFDLSCLPSMALSAPFSSPFSVLRFPMLYPLSLYVPSFHSRSFLLFIRYSLEMQPTHLSFTCCMHLHMYPKRLFFFVSFVCCQLRHYMTVTCRTRPTMTSISAAACPIFSRYYINL